MSGTDDRRQFLREALDGSIAFTPEGKQYRFAGMTATGALIESLIGTSYLGNVPKGTVTRCLDDFEGIWVSDRKAA